MPTTQPIDFSACEAELIHLPGAIQSYGALIATDLSSGRVTHVSANLGAFFPAIREPATLLGLPWAECAERLGIPVADRSAPAQALPVCRLTLASNTPERPPLTVFAHTGPTAHIWEFQSETPHAPLPETADPSGRLFSADLNPYSLAQTVADELHALTGFDRVLVYRFAADWSGEVIAESRLPALIPYLGMHYPATDIPSQARQLYRESRLRAIPSVTAPAVPLLTQASAPALDLGRALLRAVSPYHLEYLANMGVAATLTLSILVRGELWGLITCHHYLPKALCADLSLRCDQIAGRTGRWLEDYQQREAAQEAEWARQDASRLQVNLSASTAQELLASLFFGPERIEPLLEADAAVLLLDDTLICTGDSPDPSWLRTCAAWLQGRPDPDAIFVAGRLPEGLSPPAERPEAACGLLAARLSSGPEVITLMLFRHETLREVHWGGDPSQPAAVDAKQRISPRKSFARWVETVRGSSLPWPSRTAERFHRILVHIRATFTGGELVTGGESARRRPAGRTRFRRPDRQSSPR